MTTSTKTRPRSTTAPRITTQAPTTDQSAQIAQLQNQVTALLAENARLRVAPVTRGEALDAGNVSLGNGDGDVTMPVDGAPTLVRPSIEVANDVPRDWAEEMAFMEELVEVELQETNEEFPRPCVSVWVNGRHQLFIKGVRQTVRRMFVERLARCKPMHYGNVEYIDADGNKAVKWPRRTTLAHPFVVHSDSNARGKEWLRRVLQEP